MPCSHELSAMPVQDHETTLSPLWVVHAERRIFPSFRLRRQSGRLLPIWNSFLGHSQATQDWRRLLAFCSHPVPKATDNTPKVTVVKAALKAGATPHEVSQAGRWHTQNVVLHYKENSLVYQLEVALKVPSLQPP
jgi:hypothetical protein